LKNTSVLTGVYEDKLIYARNADEFYWFI